MVSSHRADKRRGSDAEKGCVPVFGRLFPFCERRAQRGKNDAGDLSGLPLVVEVKCNATYLTAAMREAKAAAARLGQDFYAACCHIKGKPAREDAFAVPAWFGAVLLRCWDDAGRPMYDEEEAES